MPTGHAGARMAALVVRVSDDAMVGQQQLEHGRAPAIVGAAAVVSNGALATRRSADILHGLSRHGNSGRIESRSAPSSIPQRQNVSAPPKWGAFKR